MEYITVRSLRQLNEASTVFATLEQKFSSWLVRRCKSLEVISREEMYLDLNAIFYHTKLNVEKSSPSERNH